MPFSGSTKHVARLYVHLVRDQLNEIGYEAEQTGLFYSLVGDENGLLLSVYGFNDKLHVLVKRIAHTMRYLSVSQKRFDVFKNSLLTTLENNALNAPYQRAIYWAYNVLTRPYWTNDQLIQALKGNGMFAPLYLTLPASESLGIKAEEVQGFVPELVSNTDLETLILGNATTDEAVQLSNTVRHTLGSKALSPDSIDGLHSLVLPSGDIFNEFNNKYRHQNHS